jgi:predicted metalloprotease with PDZ domain
VNLSFSGGLLLGVAGKVEQVLWNSAAFEAGLVVGDVLLAVNELPYNDDTLRAAVMAAKGGTTPIRLLVKTDDRVRSVEWAWHGGLRYPRLERIGPLKLSPLEQLLAARK